MKKTLTIRKGIYRHALKHIYAEETVSVYYYRCPICGKEELAAERCFKNGSTILICDDYFDESSAEDNIIGFGYAADINSIPKEYIDKCFIVVVASPLAKLADRLSALNH